MRRFVLLAAVVAGVSLVAFIALSDDQGGSDDQALPRPAVAPKQPERCPTPQVANLSVRPVSEDGMRITLHGRSYVERGGIGSIEAWWGDRAAVIADMWAPRQVGLKFFEHRYRRPGTYRISVVADAATRGCRRLQESPRARLRVRVPLSRTSYPSSL